VNLRKDHYRENRRPSSSSNATGAAKHENVARTAAVPVGLKNRSRSARESLPVVAASVDGGSSFRVSKSKATEPLRRYEDYDDRFVFYPVVCVSGYLSRSLLSFSAAADEGVSGVRTASVPNARDGSKNELPLARRPGKPSFVSVDIRSMYGKRVYDVVVRGRWRSKDCEL
jgi:hypothetical protein